MQDVVTAKQIQKIQCARRKAGIDDEAWNAMKESVGAKSTRDLTSRQFESLLSRIEGPGHPAEPRKQWKPLHKSAKKSGMTQRPPADKEAMIRKIEAILTELKLPWGYADGMARKMFGVENLRFCDGEQTYKLLQALTVYQRRKKVAETETSKTNKENS